MHLIRIALCALPTRSLDRNQNACTSVTKNACTQHGQSVANYELRRSIPKSTTSLTRPLVSFGPQSVFLPHQTADTGKPSELSRARSLFRILSKEIPASIFPSARSTQPVVVVTIVGLVVVPVRRADVHRLIVERPAAEQTLLQRLPLRNTILP